MKTEMIPVKWFRLWYWCISDEKRSVTTKF